MDTRAEHNGAWGRGKIAAIIVIAAAVLAAVVAWTASATRERIERTEHAWLQQRLDALVPPATHDNDLLSDRIAMRSPDILGIQTPVAIYRARLRGEPVAAVIYTVAPDGYQGPIEMLVAVAFDGHLIGVQIVRHRETQGLGDQFENRRADWLQNFKGRSLNDPPQQRWSVRKDGGDFDEFTGATITPRAIVRATRRALEFYSSQRERIFAAPAQH
ncbi:MAG: electron transport complex subunit RsxG [Povalibacter sp.]